MMGANARIQDEESCPQTQSSTKQWRKLDGQNRLPEIIQGIEFRDGIRQLQAAA
jgi:hypothetical protein